MLLINDRHCTKMSGWMIFPILNLFWKSLISGKSILFNQNINHYGSPNHGNNSLLCEFERQELPVFTRKLSYISLFKFFLDLALPTLLKGCSTYKVEKRGKQLSLLVCHVCRVRNTILLDPLFNPGGAAFYDVVQDDVLHDIVKSVLCSLRFSLIRFTTFRTNHFFSLPSLCLLLLLLFSTTALFQCCQLFLAKSQFLANRQWALQF